VSKNTLNFISLTIFLILIFIPIYVLSLLNLIQEQKNELLQQKLLGAELIKKEAEEKLQNDKQEKVYLLGKFNPSQRDDFAMVPADYSISGYTMYLRKETLGAFLQMAETAEKDGVELKIASATRNFDYQKNLWNNKWSGVTLVDGEDLSKSIPDGLKRFKKILEYSAVPGMSRHHWGTDIDINGASPAYFEGEAGGKIYDWLVKNAGEFGFCQPYNLKDGERPTGYNEEKWHWSYLPLSQNFTEEYKNIITTSDIKGFDGDQYVSSQDLINDYVLDINPACR